ncbi:hypothetical protein BV20DRAFT_963135 [Pilatotrama ljubarskyi]|nr:hypothetical protein BV20DRAFT_963135 [Pilatotrama ljubarskyi]
MSTPPTQDPIKVYIDAAVAAIHDPSLPPEEVADRILPLCRQALSVAPARDRTDDDDTPGLEGFMWTIWGAVVQHAQEDRSAHDRLCSIVYALKAKGSDACEGWHLWGSDFSWADLPVFRLSVREFMNGPDMYSTLHHPFAAPSSPASCEACAALAGDPPATNSSERFRAGALARTRWLNMNAFVARLWTRAVIDCADYALMTMAHMLEPYSLPPEERRRGRGGGGGSAECGGTVWSAMHEDPMELQIEVASIWVQEVGDKMYASRQILGPNGNPDWPQNAGRPGGSGGTWDGVDGYHPERWTHWKSVFEGIAKGEGRRNMIEAATAAVEVMETVERRAATYVDER